MTAPPVLSPLLTMTEEQGLTIRRLCTELDAQRATVARLTAERDAYEATARDMANNADFWRNIVLQTGELLGPECKTCDDGTVVPDVLALKVPELVARLTARVHELERERKAMREQAKP